MLVLTRRTQESICIGPDIHVTVLAVSGRSVRLGLDAPRDVPIRREELRRSDSSDQRTEPYLDFEGGLDE